MSTFTLPRHYLRRRWLPPPLPSPAIPFLQWRSQQHSSSSSQVTGLKRSKLQWKQHSFRISSMDEDFIGSMDLIHWRDEKEELSYWSDSDEGDALEFNPTGEVEQPVDFSQTVGTDGTGFAVVAYRLASIHRGKQTERTQRGLLSIIGLIAFLAFFFLYFDWCSWRIVRVPFEAFYLTRPFLVSAVLSAFAGWLLLAISHALKMHDYHRGGFTKVLQSRPIATMGGLFFISIGIAVASRIGSVDCSAEVQGAAMTTLSFAAVGFLHDALIPTRKNGFMYRWVSFLLQIAAGIHFALWLESANISTPYSMKFLVPLPRAGLVYLGKFYLVLAASCSVIMSTGVALTHRYDDLAGGVAAAVFGGLSVAALPISPNLGIFGASMSGACVGFLLHDRSKASIKTGRAGSFALGGALAALAACTGMFLPLFIASSVLQLELLFILFQVPITMATRSIHHLNGSQFRVYPFHYHLRSWGFEEPWIVRNAYIVTCFLTVLATYIGLVSA